MRELILDIETTGLLTKDKHRITEIGILEMVDGNLTGEYFHSYINPERDVPEFITELTSLTEDFLSDKPKFVDIVDGLIEFMKDDQIVITCKGHGEGLLDTAFLNMELEKLGYNKIQDIRWFNIRKYSEIMYGYKEASLDNLLDRFGIDKTEREEDGHGALLDAKLLAIIYPRIKSEYSEFIKNKKEKAS